MTGIILIIVGLISVICGVLLILTGKNVSTASHLDHSNVLVANEISKDANKEKGICFEQYVVQKFDRRYFNTKEWRGDKFTNGIYAESTLFPDLQMEFSNKGVTEEFAVECKYRTDYFQNAIELRQDQLDNYRRFMEQRKMPVFIVIGIGGQADNPAEFFIVPLKDATSGLFTRDKLQSFQKRDISNNFYYDTHRKSLK